MTARRQMVERLVRMVTLALCAIPFAFAAHADRIAFIVPSQIIYPGQTIGNAGLQEKMFTIKASAAGKLCHVD